MAKKVEVKKVEKKKEVKKVEKKVEKKEVKKVATKEVVARTSSKGRGAVVRTEILNAKKDIEANYLVLAKDLAEVHDKEYYLDYGFKTFADYAEEELETKYRKAMYFVEIWKRTKGLGLAPAKMKKIGWTKMKEIVGVMTEDNADELMELAESKSTKEVTSVVRTDYKEKTPREERTSFTKLSLKMSVEEADVITSAIEEGKKATESENDVTALEYICMEWMQERDEAAPPSLKSLIAYAKAVYGVSLAETGKATKVKAKEKVKAAEEPAEAKEEEEFDLDTLTTKKELRKFISDNDLDVKIARGATPESIRADIVKAIEGNTSTQEAPEPEKAKKTSGKKVAGKKEEKVKEATKKDKKSDDDDIDDILGI